MRLDTRAFALAAGTVAAGLFTLCALFVAVVPESTTAAVAGALVHLDLSGMQRTLTWGSFAFGLIGWTLGVALVFAAVARLYNRLAHEAIGAARPTSERVAA